MIWLCQVLRCGRAEKEIRLCLDRLLESKGKQTEIQQRQRTKAREECRTQTNFSRVREPRNEWNAEPNMNQSHTILEGKVVVCFCCGERM